MAVVAIDLDGFKAVNDPLGHAAGDRLLVAVAGGVGRLVRRTDTLARLGGDEFALLLPECGPDAALERLVEKLLEAVTSSARETAPAHAVGASAGIARSPEDGYDPESLLAAADRALYVAKTAGKGCWRFASPAVGSA